MDVVEMIESLLKDHPDLNCTELNTILNKLKNIVFISCMTPPLGKAIINIISDMLESKSYLQHVTNQWVFSLCCTHPYHTGQVVKEMEWRLGGGFLKTTRSYEIRLVSDPESILAYQLE